MPTLDEWIAGRTFEGEQLPGDKVEYYRRKSGNPGQDLTDWQVCIHRGHEIESRKGDLCGRRGQLFPVFQCAVHGECVITRFCERQKERLCYLCEEATAEART